MAPGVCNEEVQKKSLEHFARSRVVADCEGVILAQTSYSVSGVIERQPVSAAGKFRSEKFHRGRLP